MNFKCATCGTRTAQRKGADRTCQALDPAMTDPYAPVVCGGLLAPDPGEAKPKTIYQYKCDKCGHECRREHDNGVTICAVAVDGADMFCRGRMRCISRAHTMAEKYPAYYKDVRHLDVIDVYQIHHLFQIDDPSGCLQHADKKILLSGVRTGGKPKRKDIQEAYDTLGRWLEIHPENEDINQ